MFFNICKKQSDYYVKPDTNVSTNIFLTKFSEKEHNSSMNQEREK